jgi:threonine/homoserine/homoserine lactone efflux protein
MGTFLLIVLLLAVVAFLVWAGYQLAREKFAGEQNELDAQREKLRAEWHGLEQARKVNDVFFQARDALRRAERDAR